MWILNILKTVDGWFQLGLDIDGQDNSARFGHAVSISSDGSTVAIGAPENNGTIEVYGYNPATDSWSQVGADVSGATTAYGLGDAVALSSDGLIFAAGASAYSTNQGRIDVYEFDGSAWSQPRNSLDGSASDFFGTAVAISSDGSIIAGKRRGEER